MRPDPAADFAAQFPEIESEAMRLYDASESKVDYEKFNPRENTNSPTVNEFKSLWKVCLRVFDLSPVMMLSPIHGLKYRSVVRQNTQQSESSQAHQRSESLDDPEQSESTQAPGQSKPSKAKPSEVIFSPDFCRYLTTLIVHPCWQCDHVPFILALQYTVKCRIDNRAPWPSTELADVDPSLKALRDMFDNPNREPDSIKDMFKHARDTHIEGENTIFSDFLHFIGDLVHQTPSDARQPQAYLGVEALPVTIKDLKALIAAVKDFDWVQESWNCSPDDVWKAYRAERGMAKDELPRTNAQTKAYTRRSLMDVCRHIANQIQPHDNLSGSERLDQRASGDGNPRTNNEAVAPRYEIGTPLAGMASIQFKNRLEASTDIGPDVPIEDRPSRRERRHKALVDGEETEDEEEDLQRNQRHELDSRRRQDLRGRTQMNRIDNGMLSQLDFRSPHDQHLSVRQPRPLHPAPITRRASGLDFGQLMIPGEGSPKSHAEVEARLKRLEDQNTRFLNMVQSQAQEINTLRRGAHSWDQPRNEAGNTGAEEMAPIVETVETQSSELVRDLRAQIAQIGRETDQEIKELTDKVKFQKFEISDLHGELAAKDAALETERQRANRLEAVLSDFRASLMN
jgi:hypothetical protein